MYPRRKKILTDVRECRNCKKLFNVICGLIHFDNVCCSEKCFISVGYAPGPKEHLKKKKKLRVRKRPFVKKEVIPDYHFYQSREWLELRYRVLAKYGRTCMCCGRTDGEMHVDHIKPRSKYPELELIFSNLQILCRHCNVGKSNKDDKDFRPIWNRQDKF